MCSHISLNSMRSTSASSTGSTDPFDDSIFPDYKDLTFLKKLNEAKFPIYLVSYTKTDQQYVLKAFPWEEDAPSPFFTREVRFSHFSHPNLIRMVYYEYEQEAPTTKRPIKISYILMEHAKYGDFFDVVAYQKVSFHEVLIRTYFNQLLNALEALHSRGAAHLDVKLENLLLSEDFTLKLADFDLSYLPKDSAVQTKGTKHFRAPELINGTCVDPQAADIYSAGIALFLMKTGSMPYKEGEPINGLDMEKLKVSNPRKFWKKHCEFLGELSTFFSDDFKELFMWMTESNPKERPTINQIRNSGWFNKEIYSDEELFRHMLKNFKANRK